MREIIRRPGTRVIVQALVVWTICLLLAAMILDGGYVLGYYLIASLLFWSGSWIYFRNHRDHRPSDLWIFRLGPFILLILGMVGETVIAGLT